MKSINKIMLSGNVGQDPELKSTPSGVFVLNFNIAVSFPKKSKDGQKEIETDWHAVRLYGKLAELMQQYIKKGTYLYVEGTSRSTKYQDKDGQQKYYNYIIGSDVVLLGSKNKEEEHYKNDTNADQYKPYGSTGGSAKHAVVDQDDDIPF